MKNENQGYYGTQKNAKKNSCCLVSFFKICCFVAVVVSAWYFIDSGANPLDFFLDDESSQTYVTSSADEEGNSSVREAYESKKAKSAKKAKSKKSDKKAESETESSAESSSETSIEEPDIQLSDAYYYFSQLSGEDLKIYKLMLQGILNHDEEITLPANSENKLRSIYDMFMFDHPEIFYIENSFSYYGYIDRTVFLPKYTYNTDEIGQKQDQINSALSNFNTYLAGDNSEYDIIKKAYVYLIDMVDYVSDSSDNQNIYSALVNHQSVCAGYARAYQYLLQYYGIQAIYVHGESLNDDGWGSHAWNIVRCNGQYYQVDVTYGDDISDEWMKELGIHDFAYLCIDDNSMYRDHTIASEPSVPECTSLDLNFYIMNGLYSDYYDDNVVASMSNSIYSGEHTWCYQFSNYDAFAACLESISAENGIYARTVADYIGGSSYIRYQYDSTTYTIMCWY